MITRMRSGRAVAIAALLLVALAALPVYAYVGRSIEYSPIEVELISRYTEDRIAYQQLQTAPNLGSDDSLASLLIIKDRKMYLLKDGFDDPRVVRTQQLLIEKESAIIGDVWVNKINGKPDYIRITDRRIELMKNFGEEFVSRQFGSFYTSVRNAFLSKHAQTFRQLMNNRAESGLVVERLPLPKPLYLGAPEEPAKYATYVIGKTIDEKLYYAIDADGDGVTETFTVSIPDGFHWGYKSGPNIILIINNSDEEIKGIIGKLAHEAYYGTPDEEKNIIQNFPKDSDIIQEFNLDATVRASDTKK
ncbi:MAG: hypothetical protein EHM32_02010 [Spirochaetales bacterium]|nr:MAG: hypothetical protein EHM32_02010 [Spirochaetales bacterium]